MIDINEGTPENPMAGADNFDGSQRRRSPRLLSFPSVNVTADSKMALTAVAVKRSITVRKIAPRKTAAPSEDNKENTPRRSEGNPQKKQKVSTPGPVQDCGPHSTAKKAALPSPILPSSPPLSQPLQPATDPEDAMWLKKVRRSYTRLSDKSFTSPDHREAMFGFENLKTPEVGRRVGQSKTGLELSGSLSGLSSFTALLEADDSSSAVPDPDPNIPGVTVVKEKKRRMKVQKINSTELDALAAKMNAEFEEAEDFELVVE